MNQQSAPKGKREGLPLTSSVVGENARPAVRVGVIEIGSRGIRLLVTDVSRKGELRAVDNGTDYVNTKLLESIQLGEEAVRRELDGIYRATKRFRKRAVELGAQPIVSFGTEAIRRLAASEVYRTSPVSGEIKVLDQGSEAMCSLLVGLKTLPEVHPAEIILMIDQGSGSTELAAGKLGPPIVMTKAVSLKLGGQRLLKLLVSIT